MDPLLAFTIGWVFAYAAGAGAARGHILLALAFTSASGAAFIHTAAGIMAKVGGCS